MILIIYDDFILTFYVLNFKLFYFFKMQIQWMQK